jgi:hypothetical protein
MAGIIPAISPRIADIAVPINMFQEDNTKLKSPVNVDAKIDTIKTNINPINPPITERITASNKN